MQNIMARAIFLDFLKMLPYKSPPAGALSCIAKCGYMDTFSNVFILLRVLLPLPVSGASGERSFS